MKTRITTLSLLAICTASIIADEFIRQNQLNSGLVWDQHVQAPEGKNWASVPVGKGGSVFSLYARGNGSDAKLYKLDAITAGSQFPTTEINIRSKDPHFPVRTRADQPFSIVIKSQRKTNPLTLNLHHTGVLYNTKLHAADAHSAESNFGWFPLKGKNYYEASFYTSLPTTDPTQAEGEETVTLFSQDPSSKQWLPLGSASVQVWPVAQAVISGITAGKTITNTEAKLPVSIYCQDLYPDSITYVQIYRSKEKLGTLGKILHKSVVKFDTQVPQDQKIPLGNILQNLEDGHYTLEVLTITPFNERKPERLAHVSFVMDRGMHNPGLVNLGKKIRKP